MGRKDAIAPAHESHSAFNARFDLGKSSKPRDISGHWLSNDIVTKTAAMRRAFDRNRDPYIAKQLEDSERSGHGNGQGDGRAGNGSSMVKQDKPALVPHPPSPMRDATDRQSFQGRWLTEQRDAAMAQTVARDATREAVPARAPGHVEAQSGITRGPSL